MPVLIHLGHLEQPIFHFRRPMNQARATPISLALLCSAFASSIHAQNISATINAINHPTYAGIASGFALTDLKVDGQTIYNGSGYLFCADFEGITLDEDSSVYPRVESDLDVGTLEQMEIWNRFGNAQDEPLARAMAHWYVDNYYESSFLQPVNDASARQYAFQNVIWEIFGDGGTLEGLNFSTGNINRSRFAPDGANNSPILWGHMNTMLDAVKNSGVDMNYVYTLDFRVALDARQTHQDYLMLAADPALMLVPEPSTFLLGAMGSVLLLRRRRA